MGQEQQGLQEFLAQHGVPMDIQPTYQKEFQRFKTHAKDERRSGYLWSGFDGEKHFCVVGDMGNRAEKHHWFEDGVATTADPEALARAARIRDEAEKAHKEKLERDQSEAAALAWRLWEQCSEDGTHPYLEKKQIVLYGARLGSFGGEDYIAVPMAVRGGGIVNLQRIFVDKKRFLKGGRIEGTHFAIGTFELDKPILICEGFATGATLHCATGYPVVVGFTASNMVRVFEALVADGIEAKRILACCDDDKYHVVKENGRVAENDGRKAGEKIALLGARVVFPAFRSATGQPTDFNDLACSQGFIAVKNQIDSALVKAGVTGGETASSSEGDPSGEAKPTASKKGRDNSAKPDAHRGDEGNAEEPGLELQFLGHSGNSYFYTSSSNQQITELSASGHSGPNLMNLMPYRYWQAHYPADRGGPAWQWAAGDIMEKCRKVGIYDPGKVRGRGAWRDKTGLVLHLGDRLWTEGKEVPLKLPGSRYVYELGPSLPEMAAPAGGEAGRHLLATLETFPWVDKRAPSLALGWLFLHRLAGALKWRPHLWITGPKGMGKTTMMRDIIQPMSRPWGACFVGSTTEAGIRQNLERDARPVVFDEAETAAKDKRSGQRMQGIIELARQASSPSGDAVIAKGTATGKGKSFRCESAFALGSIRVSVHEEQDISRWTILELKRVDSFTVDFGTVQEMLYQLDSDFSSAFFSRAVHQFSNLEASIKLFGRAVARRRSSREGDQLGTLIAAYWCALNDALPSAEDVERIADEFCPAKDKEQAAGEADEWMAIDHLLASTVVKHSVSGQERIIFHELVNLAQESKEALTILERHGVTLFEGTLFVAKRHPELSRIYGDSRWDNMWAQSLARLPQAKEDRPRFGIGPRPRCIGVPLNVALSREG